VYREPYRHSSQVEMEEGTMGAAYGFTVLALGGAFVLVLVFHFSDKCGHR